MEDVTPEAKDPWGDFRRGASAKTKINRQEFRVGVEYGIEAGGFLVGDDIEITIDVELVRPAA